MQRSLAGGGVVAGAALLASTLVLAGGPTLAKSPHSVRAASSSGGTIVDALSEEPVTLNPAVGHTGFEPIVEATMFENLFQILPNDQLTTVIAKVIPTVANGGISKSGLVYTFHLRHNVKWSNGQPFTANDVKETWQLITNPAFQALSTSGWSDVKAMKIMDPYDFQLILKQPDPALLVDAFSTESPGIIPYSVFHGMTGAQARTAKFNHDPTVTDGPFQFQSWVPGASITVVRNPYWFGPRAKASKIVFEIVSSQSTILSDAQAHTINVYYFGSIDQLKELQAIKGAHVHIVVDPAWEAAYVNLRNPVLRNLKVREALEMGINRAGLVQSVWNGKAKLLAADQPPDSWSFDPNLRPLPYNPIEAKKLLEEAGYKMGPSGYMEKNGKILSLIYATTSGISWRQSSEQLVQYWLKQIGVKITIHNEPAGAYFGTLLPSGKGWDLAEFQFGDTPDPAEVPFSVFATGQGYNWEDFSNAQVDRLFKAQETAPTQAARRKDLWQIEAILAKQLPALWYYAPEEIDTSIDMTGYVPNPWATDTWNSYDWAPTKAN